MILSTYSANIPEDCLSTKKEGGKGASGVSVFIIQAAIISAGVLEHNPRPPNHFSVETAMRRYKRDGTMAFFSLHTSPKGTRDWGELYSVIRYGPMEISCPPFLSPRMGTRLSRVCIRKRGDGYVYCTIYIYGQLWVVASWREGKGRGIDVWIVQNDERNFQTLDHRIRFLQKKLQTR